MMLLPPAYVLMISTRRVVGRDTFDRELGTPISLAPASVADLDVRDDSGRREPEFMLDGSVMGICYRQMRGA